MSNSSHSPDVPAQILLRQITAPSEPYGEPYTLQTGKLAVDTNVFRGGTLLPHQSRLVLDLLPNAIYTTLVETVQYDVNDVLTISGRIIGESLSTFTLSEKDGIVLADLTDMSNGRVFKIKYAAPLQEHVVIEYDATNMPLRYDGHGTERPL